MLTDAVAALCPDRPPRAWSLIVTVLGDIGGETEISAARLQDIIGPLGVRAEAFRVAVHRLKGDGWLLARRDGRSSRYLLHSDRLAETRKASARIYDFAPKGGAGWAVVALAPDARPPETGAQIAPQLWLVPLGTPGWQMAPQDPLPDWARAAVMPAGLDQGYARLLTGLRAVAMMPDFQEDEAAAIRVLIVHEWRRLVLRQGALPDAFLPSTCPAAECRAQVAELLQRYPP